ncbi:hypothetical protein M0813_22476 [Anaeramoeba flamelloides]|uniref:Galectin domain-containing protein n=1 Tax=Anaeramoeba flamelloides TaxID=1746091 RepID=A0ABQ8YCL8_9EUKA|nr:hypothetical protein M0813_22476 [Anaeramoeba flamelloides]
MYEKIKIILNKIQNEEKQNEKTIQKSLENQNKFKEKIKNICKKIENDSNLLIQKIQDSKINHLNLFKKIEIIINNKIQTILEDTEKKQKKISKKKIKIKTIKKLKKDKNHIKLIQGGKEIIKSERKSEKEGRKGKGIEKEKEKAEKELAEKKKEKEKERKSESEILSKDEETEEYSEWDFEEEKKRKKKKKKEKEKEKEIRRAKEEFDPEMNVGNRIILKNKNITAWNPSVFDGKICGKKIYSSGKHEIKIKIDQFPNPKNEWNQINLGVIKTENRKNFIKYYIWEGTYFFRTNWDQKKLKSRKRKIENGKWTEKIYPKKIILKKNDIFTIFLDMDQKKISFKINEKNLEGWENLPEKVNFFAYLSDQKVEEKNQITII